MDSYLCNKSIHAIFSSRGSPHGESRRGCECCLHACLGQGLSSLPSLRKRASLPTVSLIEAPDACLVLMWRAARRVMSHAHLMQQLNAELELVEYDWLASG